MVLHPLHEAAGSWFETGEPWHPTIHPNGLKPSLSNIEDTDVLCKISLLSCWSH